MMVLDAIRAQRDAEVWAIIEGLLNERGAANTREIAAALGLTMAATQKRLRDLRDMGDIRHGPMRSGSNIHTWVLVTDQDAAETDRIQPLLTKAVQIGIFNRDPLMHALYGIPRGLLAAEARCVGCQQPQGEPHDSGCIFASLTIGG